MATRSPEAPRTAVPTTTTDHAPSRSIDALWIGSYLALAGGLLLGGVLGAAQLATVLAPGPVTIVVLVAATVGSFAAAPPVARAVVLGARRRLGARRMPVGDVAGSADGDIGALPPADVPPR